MSHSWQDHSDRESLATDWETPDYREGIFGLVQEAQSDWVMTRKTAYAAYLVQAQYSQEMSAACPDTRREMYAILVNDPDEEVSEGIRDAVDEALSV